MNECPKCGLGINTVKKPGALNPWTGDLPVMINPCTCIVDVEELKA